MNTVQTELAERLQEEISSGLSRRDIARKAKVSEGTIRNALEGKPLTHEVLERLAKNYFKVPIDEMYRMAAIFPPESSPRGKAIRMIEHLLPQLPEDDQAEILEIVRLKVDRHKRQQGDS